MSLAGLRLGKYLVNSASHANRVHGLVSLTAGDQIRLLVVRGTPHASKAQSREPRISRLS